MIQYDTTVSYKDENTKTSDNIKNELLHSLANLFDFSIVQHKIKIPIPEIPKQFGLGYICGSSGSGKTSLLKHFKTKLELEELTNITECDDKPICLYFDSVDDATERLCMGGLGVVATWFSTYNNLSAGRVALQPLRFPLEIWSKISIYVSKIFKIEFDN